MCALKKEKKSAHCLVSTSNAVVLVRWNDLPKSEGMEEAVLSSLPPKLSAQRGCREVMADASHWELNECEREILTNKG